MIVPLVVWPGGFVLVRGGILDRERIVLDRTLLILDRRHIVLDRSLLIPDSLPLILDKASLTHHNSLKPPCTLR